MKLRRELEHGYECQCLWCLPEPVFVGSTIIDLEQLVENRLTPESLAVMSEEKLRRLACL